MTISIQAEKMEMLYLPPSEFCKAVIAGDYQKVKEMLQKKPNLANDGYGYGTTAIYDAAKYGHVEIAKLLFENNVRISRSRPLDKAPLYIAAKNGHLDMVKLLIANGQQVYKNFGTGPLNEAVINNHVEVAKYLIEKGVELNLRHHGQYSSSLLHISVFYGYDYFQNEHEK